MRPTGRDLVRRIFRTGTWWEIKWYRVLFRLGYPVQTLACRKGWHDECHGRVIFSQDCFEDYCTVPCRCRHHTEGE